MNISKKHWTDWFH